MKILIQFEKLETAKCSGLVIIIVHLCVGGGGGRIFRHHVHNYVSFCKMIYHL